jgi:hypothetical protein
MNGFEFYTQKDHESISSLTAFARCPRLYFYGSGCRLRERTPHPALTYGTAIHAGMPYAIRGDVAGAMAMFMGEWRELDSLEDSKRNSQRAVVLFENISQAHKDPIYTPIQPPKGRYVLDESVTMDETVFALEVGMKVPFVGKIDCVGRHRDTGGVFAVEYKTTSRMGAGFASSFNYCPQSLGYAFALKVILENEHVEGTITEILGVAKTKAEILLNVAFITEEMIEEFIDWMLRTEKGIRRCEENESFKKNCSACYPYAQHGVQGFQCKFKDLCMSQDWTGLKEMFVEADYNLFSTVEGKE